ncbi:hypothetical protein FS749_004228 [Ceratobasidium sp. UAMH 11750]|nr:hypothetical protein FS749_004228 [Ceratobasidium sp. UAMH 11750]
MAKLLPGNLLRGYQKKLKESGENVLDPGPGPGSASKDTTGSQGTNSVFPDNQDADKNATEQVPEKPTTENPTGGKTKQAQQENKEAPTPRYTEGPRPGYDDYGQELGKDARFWKAYVQEAKVWDADMVDGWNNSLDLILIFAALFSAISTAFVLESSKTLQPDPAETSAQTLSLVSQTLLAMANTQPGSPFNFTPPEPSPFVAPVSAVCVNALWFLSLSLSVAVSLIAMLGKDWARGYMAELTGQPYQQARKRQQRWDALQQWRMPQVIIFLPSLLHLALLLFAVGLTVSLWKIHLGAAIPVLIVTIIATGAYVVSTVLPLVHEHCPYYTPVSRLLPILHKYLSRLISPLISACQRFTSRIHGSHEPSIAALDLERAQSAQAPTPQKGDSNLMDDLSSRALSWLIVNYGDTKSLNKALQAIAGADHRLPLGPLKECQAPELLVQRLENCCATRQKTGEYFLKDGNLLEAATLYSQALGIITCRRISYDNWSSANSQMQCVIDYGLDSPSFNPNKAAFTLASQAMFGFMFEAMSAWIASTISLLDSHFGDQITLEDPALLALLKASVYVIGSSRAKDLRSLVLALVRALSALDRYPTSQAHGLIGVALTGFAIMRRNLGDFQDFYRHYESQPPRTATAMEGLILFGLLDLLKPDSATIPEDSEPVTITQTLRHFSLRPKVLAIHNLPEQTPYSCLENQVEPQSDGSFTNSESVRAAYLSIFDRRFLENLTSQEALHALGLALENLWSAKSSNLKQSCCHILGGVRPFGYWASINCRDWPQLFKPLLRGLESNDDRVLPYLMAAICYITRRIIESDLPEAEKHELLGPALPHELFVGAAQTRSNPGSPPRSLFEMAEVWLLRLESMQGAALLHIRNSSILSYLEDLWELDSDHGLELEDRASALSERCKALYERDLDQPLWSEDPAAD